MANEGFCLFENCQGHLAASISPGVKEDVELLHEDVSVSNPLLVWFLVWTEHQSCKMKTYKSIIDVKISSTGVEDLSASRLFQVLQDGGMKGRNGLPVNMILVSPIRRLFMAGRTLE